MVLGCLRNIIIPGIWFIMMKCPRAKKSTSQVVIFLYLISTIFIVNFASRGMMFTEVTDNTGDIFRFQIVLAFMVCNSVAFHDIKWLVFGTLPMFIIGQCVELQSYQDSLSVHEYHIMVVAASLVLGSHYLQQLESSMLVI